MNHSEFKGGLGTEIGERPLQGPAQIRYLFFAHMNEQLFGVLGLSHGLDFQETLECVSSGQRIN